MYALIKLLVLPPASLVLLIVFGFVVRRWAQRTGTAVAIVGFILLYGLSTSFVGTRLLSALEAGIAPPDLSVGGPGAIVVLSAGQADLTPTPGLKTVDATGLERLRLGVRVHRATGLPILVTGGPSRHDPTPVALPAEEVLRTDFGIAPVWVETEARNTFENAVYSARILRPLGIRSVYVVSQAWHLPRAVAAFAAAGLPAVPTPSSFTRVAVPEATSFLPSAGGLLDSYFAMHEALGLLWYRWAYFQRS